MKFLGPVSVPRSAVKLCTLNPACLVFLFFYLCTVKKYCSFFLFAKHLLWRPLILLALPNQSCLIWWFASPLLNLQADSCTCLQNGDAPMMPPRYVYLNLPEHVMRSVSRFRLRGLTLAVESSIWRSENRF